MVVADGGAEVGWCNQMQWCWLGEGSSEETTENIEAHKQVPSMSVVVTGNGAPSGGLVGVDYQLTPGPQRLSALSAALGPLEPAQPSSHPLERSTGPLDNETQRERTNDCLQAQLAATGRSWQPLAGSNSQSHTDRVTLASGLASAEPTIATTSVPNRHVCSPLQSNKARHVGRLTWLLYRLVYYNPSTWSRRQNGPHPERATAAIAAGKHPSASTTLTNLAPTDMISKRPVLMAFQEQTFQSG
ncbi:hypothetical protein E4U55_002503 [Claviceps digitariae]|nr:hypothetical protein E4U55_002503 [Claviceps digitariae]